MIIDERKDNKVTVSIICNTYNHEPYIKETINSFLEQKTSFDYEILVYDDASTDNTQRILKEFNKKYSGIFFLYLGEVNLYQNDKELPNLFQFCKGKYIAICEGDDIWNNVNKLQEQVDLLERNRDYSAVGGFGISIDDFGNKISIDLPIKKYRNTIISENKFLNNPFCNIFSNTLMFRKNSLIDGEYFNGRKVSTKVGDILLMLKLYEKGQIYVCDECYEKHIIQKRINASNYNSLYSREEKLLNSIQVINAIDQCYSKDHNLKHWIRYQFITYFVICLFNFEINKYMQLKKIVDNKYIKNVVVMTICEIPFLIRKGYFKIVNRIFTKMVK